MRICVQHYYECVFRVELDESQCLCIATENFVCVLVCYALLGENMLPVFFCYLYSRDCLASRDMTVAFRVWLSEMIAVGCF